MFQLLPPYLYLARHGYDSVDFVWKCLATSAVSTVAYPSRAWPKYRVEVGIAAPSVTGQKLFSLPA